MRLLPLFTLSISAFTIAGASPVINVEEIRILEERAGTLRELAAAKGKYFGTATLVGEFQGDATYKSVGGNFVSAILQGEGRGDIKRARRKARADRFCWF